MKLCIGCGLETEGTFDFEGRHWTNICAMCKFKQNQYPLRYKIQVTRGEDGKVKSITLFNI